IRSLMCYILPHGPDRVYSFTFSRLLVCSALILAVNGNSNVKILIGMRWRAHASQLHCCFIGFHARISPRPQIRTSL
ncbi:hypothetical protein C8J56DRAFT_993823, partial [Mycena floridula]